MDLCTTTKGKVPGPQRHSFLHLCSSNISRHINMDDFKWLKPLLTRESLRNPAIVKMINAYVESLKLVGIGLALVEKEEMATQSTRFCWSWPYLQRRVEQGVYDNLIKELVAEASHLFRQYLRVDKSLFDPLKP